MVDQPIDDLVVTVKPDFKGFRAALIAGVARASRNVSVVVPVKIDTKGAAAELRAWAKRQSTSVRIGAALDSTGLTNSVRDAARRASAAVGKIKVQVEADAAHLRRSVTAALAGYSTTVKVDVDVDTDRVARELASMVRKVKMPRMPSGGGGGSSFLDNIIDTGARGVRPMTLLYTAIAAISPVLVAMAASASYAALSFTALGAATIGVIGAVTAVTLAFGSVTDYMKQYEAVQKSAVQQQAQSAEQEMQRASALRSGLVQLGSARRAHAEAIRGERAAEEALHKAREQAKRDLEDLIELRSDLRRMETGAAQDLEQARQDEAEVNNNYFATDLERRQAKQRTEEAKDALSDLARDRKRNAEDLKKIQRGGGIEGMDGVKQAKDTLRNATEQVVETRQRIRDAELDLAEAHKRAAAQANENTAAENELARQWRDMSGPARNLVTWLREHADLFKEYRRQMERAVLPGFITFLDQITDRGKNGKQKSVLDILADGAATLGKVVGDTVAALGKAMNSKWFKDLWAVLSAENGKAFKSFGDTLVILLEPIARLIKASAPLLTMFADWVKENAQKFADWIDTFSDADLEKFFKDAATELKKWWAIAKEIFLIVLGVFKAALPSGGNLTERLGEFLKKIREWIEDDKGQKKLKDFFEMLESVNWEYIAKGITSLGAALGGFAVGGPWGAAIAGGGTALTLFWSDLESLAPKLGHWFSMDLPDYFSERPGEGWAGLGKKTWELFKEEVGYNAVVGIWDGMVQGWNWIKEKISSWWTDFTDENKKVMKIKSPSLVMADIGKNLIEGIWQGMTEKWADMLPTVLDWISKTFGDPLKKAFGDVGKGARDMFTGAFAGLTKVLAGPVGKMLDWLDANVIDPLNKVLTAIHVTAKIPNVNSRLGETVGGAAGGALTTIGAGLTKKAAGGIIDGYSPNSRADNIPAMLTADEFVQPVSAVKKYGVGMMEDIRTGRFPTFADGGLVGKLLSSLGGNNIVNQLGAGAIKLMGGNTVKDIAAAFAPAGGGDGGGALGGPLGATGVIPEWVKAAKAGSRFGRNSGIGNWLYQVVKSAGLAKSNQGIFNARRTATGNLSMHGYGRAVDLPASMAIFNFLRKNYGSKMKELIYSPAGNSQIYNGRNHMYTGITRRMHFNHVHASYAKGGRVDPINAAYFDTGGKLAPGATLALNNTGQPETVRTAGQEKALMERNPLPTRLDRRDLTLLAGYIAMAVSGQQITMDGRKVAETVASYDYLPGGM